MVATQVLGAKARWGGTASTWCRWLLLAAAVLGIHGAVAQPPKYEGLQISRVDFEPPASRQPLLSSDLTSLVTLKAGELVTEAGVSQSIENLFASGRYSDIVADAKPDGAGGVILTFTTKPAYFVGRVLVTGVPQPPTANQLNNETKLQFGNLYTKPQGQLAVASIQNLLRENGYFRADVQLRENPDPSTGNIDLRFDATTGKRARFSQPAFLGQTQFTPEKLVSTTKWQSLFPTRKFREVTAERVQKGLERLRKQYLKKDRLLAKVTLSSLAFDDAANSVRPIVTIDAGPRVRIRTSGVKLSKGQLRSLIPVYQEQTVDRDLLLEGQRNLERHFESQGYFDVAVSYENKVVSPDEQLIDYKVERGQRYRLVQLRVDGNRYFDPVTIREQLSLVEATKIRYRNGRYSEALLTRDVAALKNLYRANGFLDVDVQARVEDDFKGKQSDIAVFLSISEGHQAVVDKLELRGAGAEEQYFRDRLQLLPGQPFSNAAVSLDQELILAHLFSLGYINADVDVSAAPSPQKKSFDVSYVIKPGQRQFVRKVIQSGLDTTNLKLFYQRVPLKPGDPLSLTDVTDAQRRLYDLGIFARVDVAVQNPEGQESLKYVLYRIEEARRYSFNLGFGAEIARIGGSNTSLDSPAGSANFAPRVSLGVSRLNFLGIGHTLSLQTRLSSIQQRGVFTYVAPQFIGRDDLSLSFTLIADRSRDIRTYQSRRFEGTLQMAQRYRRDLTFQYRLTYRQVNISDIKITPDLIPLLSRPVRVGLFGGGIIQDRRDDPIDSSRGIFNSFDIGVATKALGSRQQFVRVLARNTTYHRIGKDLVLARTTNFGFIEPIGTTIKLLDPLDGVPLPERFFSGGATSHRGFPENQAGQRDLTTGFPIGGNALLINGVELRFPLLGDNLRGVLFHDAGNAYRSLSDISFRYRQRDRTDFDYLVHTVGIGLRYKTPVGPVRVDLGYTLNPTRFRGCRGSLDQLLQADGPCNPASPQANFQDQRVNPFQFHFSLGQTF